MIRRLQACFLLLLCIDCIEGYNPYSYETFGEKENEERKSNQCKVVKASDCVYYTPGWYYDQKNRFCFFSDKKMCVQSGHRFNDCTECMQTCNSE
ncbi:hypothetical protein V5799_026695 [Amblyomma americanum]|uniref:Pancreatic trypsin inhibitor n=1 Tax=Amblyomma americanum TaxID=6943 RepID=A0AAQ4DHV2_AMBAM